MVEPFSKLNCFLFDHSCKNCKLAIRVDHFNPRCFIGLAPGEGSIRCYTWVGTLA